ncbi:MAG: DNA polymerase III subunit alpha [Bacillota bacterium]
MAYTSLFLETSYSFSGSNIRLDALFNKASALGYNTLALTDKNMHAAYKFYHYAKKYNINPILGLHIYLEPILNGTYISATCYARNQKGYQTLLKLATLSSFNDTLKIELFKRYSDHITTVLHMHEGELAQALNNKQSFITIVNELKEHIKPLFLAKHPAFDMPISNLIQTVPVDYVYYNNEEEKAVFNTLFHIFDPDKPFTDIDTVNASFKTPSYFNYLSKEDATALSEFIDQHTFDLIIKQPKLPAYPKTQGLSSEAYLKSLSMKGLKKRLKDIQNVTYSIYIERLNYELKTIHHLGYDDYFLIVWDVVKYAKKSGYLVGPGRGSAPGSLVAYVLGITDIDPIQFDLLFERFLNKDRVSMPDIDIDFPDYAREAIISYTQETFHQENVSYICTFGTFLIKSALRETARQFSIDTKLVNEIVKYSSDYESIKDMIDKDRDVQNRMVQYSDVHNWLTIAKNIEGLPKHVGTHAAGIIISDDPITEYSPIQSGLQGGYQTQFEQSDLEAIGLLKMDFLGLRNLSMIETIINDIKTHEGTTINMYKLPLNDEKTFDLLRKHSTSGIFQLESRGMRQLIKKMQIKTFDDIVVILALYRPGPMESIPTYLRRRNKEEKVTYLTESLEPILESTNGILLYQEQIMAIASKFAGYTMSEADLLRRAVSKKVSKELEDERERFVKKAKANYHDTDLAHKIYDYIVKFANYGFNKSHSVAYALISYWMAYLKANYPAYFISVLMQSALSNETLMREYIQEAMQLDLTVSPPHIELSEARFMMKHGVIYYPLTGIKNIGKTVYQVIHEARKEHSFSSFVDFVAKTYKHLNKRHYQYLIYAGACDGFGINKHTMISNIESIIHFLDYQGDIGLDDYVYTKVEEFTAAELKNFEQDAIGIHLSFDPLKAYAKYLKMEQYHTVTDCLTIPFNQSIKLIAYISKIKEITTKKGDLMAFLTLEDKVRTLDAVVFPSVYKNVAHLLAENTVYGINGKVNVKENNRQFIVEKLTQI